MTHAKGKQTIGVNRLKMVVGNVRRMFITTQEAARAPRTDIYRAVEAIFA
jgi:hypothetical protein